MRATMLVVALIGLGACRGGDCEGQNCTTDDTSDTVDTSTEDTTDTDDTVDTDTEEPPPEPAIYEPDLDVQFDLAVPVEWEPLSYEQVLYNDTIAGYVVSFTLGAEVTGTSDLSLLVDSHLDRENDGDYVQYFTGKTNGGHLDNTMHINFPMVLAIDSLQLDISSLVLDATIPEANELDWEFTQHAFNTLLLSGDSQSTTYVATPFNWTWTSGQIDPASWAPYVTIDLDVDVSYETTFQVNRYDLLTPGTPSSVLGTQTRSAGRIDVNAQVGELGSEPPQILFDGEAEGEVRNTLDLDTTLSITLESVVIDPPITIEIPVVIPLGDDGAWKITLDPKRITHPKDTTP